MRPPFAWYDPSANQFFANKDDAHMGAVLWPLHRFEDISEAIASEREACRALCSSWLDTCLSKDRIIELLIVERDALRAALVELIAVKEAAGPFSSDVPGLRWYDAWLAARAALELKT